MIFVPKGRLSRQDEQMKRIDFLGKLAYYESYKYDPHRILATMEPIMPITRCNKREHPTSCHGVSFKSTSMRASEFEPAWFVAPINLLDSPDQFFTT